MNRAAFPVQVGVDPIEDLRRALRDEKEYFQGVIAHHLEMQCQRQEDVILRYLGHLQPASLEVAKETARSLELEVAEAGKVVPPAARNGGKNSPSSSKLTTVQSTTSQGLRRGKSSRLSELSKNAGLIAPPSQGQLAPITGDPLLAQQVPSERLDAGSIPDYARYDWSNMGITNIPSVTTFNQVQDALEPLMRAVQRLEATMLTQHVIGSHMVEDVTPPGSPPKEESEVKVEVENGDDFDDIGLDVAISAKMSSAPGLRKSVSSYQLQSEHSSMMARRIYETFSAQIEWWADLEEPQRHGRLAEFVTSTTFETICALGILLNMVFLLVTTNHEMELTGDQLSYQKSFEFFFLVFFSIEMTLKLAVHKIFYFCNSNMAWNIFDFVLVVISIVEQMLSGTGSAGMMRSLRTFKLAKILRGARLMRFFTQLSVMLNSLLGSLMTLFWSFVMLGLLFYLFSVVLVQGVAAFLLEKDVVQLTELQRLQPTATPEDLDRDVELMNFDGLIRYFGSIQVCMMTLYKTTFGGDDWSLYYNFIEPTGALNAMVFVVFVSLMHIAMLNILTGIFVENALGLAQPDREVQALQRRMQRLSDEEDFRHVFKEIYKLCNNCPVGVISRDAFVQAAVSGRMSAHMEVLGLNLKESSSVNLFFPGKQQHLDEASFIEACLELRGTASSLDLHTLLSSSVELMENQKRLQETMAEQLSSISQRLAGRPRAPKPAALSLPPSL